MKLAIAFAFGLVTLEGIGSSSAQDWPTRPVTMVVPSAAGSSGDVLARILAQRLSEVLGQQVIVENAGGAGGMTAVARLAKAAPDGYQSDACDEHHGCRGIRRGDEGMTQECGRAREITPTDRSW